MTRALVLEIGQVRIDAVGRPEDAERIEATLRAGLDLLADKLASSAYARDPEAMGVAIAQMQVDDLSREDWLGSRGAARVAEVMFERIAAGGNS